ncbi:molybdopterin-binding protein [Actinophytocola xinjiangensis]|uniref:Molybdopterin-binding protein n=1 Tax=Actinophytocola xinjiangensis TaxID=485602 RepID=A0A7Z0WQ31_9PSEU|nr:molybdopterin-dependent oxidoreductase [Actinophytocola xinjiangensis]OLF12826.1 molybdopterin-binding protein [Actinophytocola xinjiangensis]
MDDENSPAVLSRWTAILIAVLAMVTALAVGHLVAALTDPDASPFVAVGDSVRDLSPPAVTEFAISDLGEAKKPLLFGGIAAMLLVLATVAGLLSRRRPWPGLALATVVGVVGLLAVLDQYDVDTVGLLAPVSSLVAGAATFGWLHRLAASGLTRPADTSRRRFLWTGAGVAVGAAAFGGLGQVLAGRVDVEASRAGVGALTPSVPAPPIPATADFGTPRFITSNRDFYRVDTALLGVPQVRAQDWLLRVHGLVDEPRTFTFNDIRARRLVERTITMTCVSNQVGGGYVSTANFVGVPLRDLLDETGVRSGSDQLFSTSVDGWTAGTPVEAVLDRDRGALLAIGMNGEPLPTEHGFPARMVVPGLYGFVSATKWVVDLELTTFDAKRSYWLERDWAREAPIKTQSRIDAPRSFATVPAGPVTIAGTAWAQTVGIDRVEVRVDGGAWRPATLATKVNDQTWRMWRVEITLGPGTHTAEVRATDRTGRTQPRQRVAPIPDGATGWHSRQFTVG